MRAKKIISIALALLLFAGTVALTACTPEGVNTVRVMVEDGEHFTVSGDKIKTVERGADVSFDIVIDNGCYYISNNLGAEFEDGVLTLRSVVAPQTVVLDVCVSAYVVKLEPTDGMTVIVDGEPSTVGATLSVPYGGEAVFEIEIDEERYMFSGAIVRYPDGSTSEAEYSDGRLILSDVRSDAEVFVQLRNAPETDKEEVTVRLLEGEGYTVTGESSVTIAVGEDVSFEVDVWDGYGYVSNNCGATYDDGTVTLTDVTADQDIILNFRRTSTSTVYYEHGRVDVTDAGSTLIYTATADSGYVFTRWTHEGELQAYSNGITVPAGTELEPVFAPESDTLVVYHTNGGELKNSDEDSVTYAFESDVYLYPAALGEWCFRTFERDGYVPIEYNTEPDGSGTPYSIGSRIFESGNRIDLYVIWEKENAATDFETEYISENGENVGVRLIGYIGTDTEAVIPTEINGLPVTEIAEGCFEGSDVTRVVITENIRTIDHYAFKDSAQLRTLYMCDSVEYVYNDSFEGCDELSELRMMAVLPPVYTDHLIGTTVRRFELLVATRNDHKNNIIFYGGSSTFQGIDGSTLSRSFNNDLYRIINGGQNAYVSGVLMLDLYSQFMKRGDALIFTPELGRDMYSEELALPAWIVFEEFFDAFRYIDLRDYGNIFGSFYDFQHGADNFTFVGKVDQLEDGVRKTYEDYEPTLDEWFTRGPNFNITTANLETNTRPIEFDYFKSQVLNVFNKLYTEKITARGVNLYFGWYGFWEYAFDEPDPYSENSIYAEYERWLKENLAFKYISDYRDHLFGIEDMTDSNSHLTREAAIRHSLTYVEEMKPALREDGFLV